MSILSRIIGGVASVAVPKTAANGGKPATATAPNTAQAARALRSPFEEDMSKLSRTPRGLSFAERSWTRES
jgi:hypothetical protein